MNADDCPAPKWAYVWLLLHKKWIKQTNFRETRVVILLRECVLFMIFCDRCRAGDCGARARADKQQKAGPEMHPIKRRIDFSMRSTY
ncbi:MAG TPA: hypothetical protein VF928_14595 [Usitatibacteraceae bacterium]